MPLIATLIANPQNKIIKDNVINLAVACVGGSGVKTLSPGTAIEFELPVGDTAFEARQTLAKAIGDLPVDIVVQESATRKKRCLIADMDSTMIDQECIDELAAEIGMKDEVAEITRLAMNGEIEFEPALRKRVSLLKGLSASIVDTVLEKRITLASGGKQLLAAMKAHHAHTALVSGGFTAFTSRIARELGFDEHHANTLIEENGMLTGEVQEPILGAEAKVQNLLKISKEQGISPDEFIAVGDGANDLPMLTLAGTGVALHAKPSVAESAKIRIDHGDLTALLYLQGYSDEAISGTDA